MYGKTPITGQNRANPIGFERRQDTGALRRHFAKAALLPHSNSSANKSLARYLPGFAVIYREISKGFLEMGISKFESYVVSQPVQALEIFPTKSPESPPLAGLLPQAKSLRVPCLAILRPAGYIDPKQEARQYRERMLESARAILSAEKLALFEEELKSPCYEEVAVFQAFSRIVMGARKELAVVDTAPTGHTLLLLDTAGTYHRQVTQQAVVGAGPHPHPSHDATGSSVHKDFDCRFAGNDACPRRKRAAGRLAAGTLTIEKVATSFVIARAASKLEKWTPRMEELKKWVIERA